MHSRAQSLSELTYTLLLGSIVCRKWRAHAERSAPSALAPARLVHASGIARPALQILRAVCFRSWASGSQNGGWSGHPAAMIRGACDAYVHP